MVAYPIKADRFLILALGEGWASRVFFSDDGSTAVEVALKMAFGKYQKDNGANLFEKDRLYVKLLLLVDG